MKPCHHVIVIGVDGAGNFFREADTPTLDRIFQNGAVSYDVITSNPTISGECWGSMLHGVTPDVHGLTNSIVSSRPYPTDSPYPSVFRILREAMPDAELASFCNWNPINFGIIEEGLGVTKGTGNDAQVTEQVCRYLEDHDPAFVFIQFDEVDGAGHGHGYGTPAHLAQITVSDGYIRQIYEAYEKKGILDDTLFIVTADHGGHDHGHGGWTDGEKYIMFAAAGPNVKAGTVGEMQVRDITAVVLWELGLADRQPASWTARVPSGLFEGVEAKERPVYVIPYAYEHRTHVSVPTPAGDKGVAVLLGADRILAYLPFDGDTADASGHFETVRAGKIYFPDGYFGSGVKLDDGCVTLPGFDAAKKSFSVAFWMKCGGVVGDPAVCSNKDWNSGKNPGFALVLTGTRIRFNAGDGENRMDADAPLPLDCRDGWVYVIAAVDREAAEVRISYDFGPFQTAKIPDALKDASFSAFPCLNLGQDGTGAYGCHLSAVLDEWILAEGVLTEDDAAKLKEYYGV